MAIDADEESPWAFGYPKLIGSVPRVFGYQGIGTDRFLVRFRVIRFRDRVIRFGFGYSRMELKKNEKIKKTTHSNVNFDSISPHFHAHNGENMKLKAV